MDDYVSGEANSMIISKAIGMIKSQLDSNVTFGLNLAAGMIVTDSDDVKAEVNSISVDISATIYYTISGPGVDSSKRYGAVISYLYTHSKEAAWVERKKPTVYTIRDSSKDSHSTMALTGSITTNNFNVNISDGMHYWTGTAESVDIQVNFGTDIDIDMYHYNKKE